jgi:hypothetical protein
MPHQKIVKTFTLRQAQQYFAMLTEEAIAP